MHSGRSWLHSMQVCNSYSTEIQCQDYFIMNSHANNERLKNAVESIYLYVAVNSTANRECEY